MKEEPVVTCVWCGEEHGILDVLSGEENDGDVVKAQCDRCMREFWVKVGIKITFRSYTSVPRQRRRN